VTNLAFLKDVILTFLLPANNFSEKGLAYQEELRLNKFETTKDGISTELGEIYVVDESGERIIDAGPGPYLVSICQKARI
jgi:hypothetical protein